MRSSVAGGNPPTEEGPSFRLSFGSRRAFSVSCIMSKYASMPYNSDLLSWMVYLVGRMLVRAVCRDVEAGQSR